MHRVGHDLGRLVVVVDVHATREEALAHEAQPVVERELRRRLVGVEEEVRRQVAVVGEALPEVEARRDVHVVGEADRVVAAARQRPRPACRRGRAGCRPCAPRRATTDRGRSGSSPPTAASTTPARRCARSARRRPPGASMLGVLADGVAVGAEMIGAQRVDHDEDDVRCARAAAPPRVPAAGCAVGRAIRRLPPAQSSARSATSAAATPGRVSAPPPGVRPAQQRATPRWPARR